MHYVGFNFYNFYHSNFAFREDPLCLSQGESITITGGSLIRRRIFGVSVLCFYKKRQGHNGTGFIFCGGEVAAKQTSEGPQQVKWKTSFASSVTSSGSTNTKTGEMSDGRVDGNAQRRSI